MLVQGGLGQVIYRAENQGLTTYPTDIASDTTFIILTGNEITTIDNIYFLPTIERISLVNNSLVEFPNFQEVAGTLHGLYLDNNALTMIPTDIFLPLTLLALLTLDNNPLVSLPNFGVMLPNPAAGPLDIWLLGTEPFVCDWKMVAVREAMAVNRVTFSKNMPGCSSPSQFETQTISQLTTADMIFEGQCSQNTFTFLEIY